MECLRPVLRSAPGADREFHAELGRDPSHRLEVFGRHGYCGPVPSSWVASISLPSGLAGFMPDDLPRDPGLEVGHCGSWSSREPESGLRRSARPTASTLPSRGPAHRADRPSRRGPGKSLTSPRSGRSGERQFHDLDRSCLAMERLGHLLGMRRPLPSGYRPRRVVVRDDGSDSPSERGPSAYESFHLRAPVGVGRCDQPAALRLSTSFSPSTVQTG